MADFFVGNKTKIDFQDLMPHRIHEILLVASPYDAFILEQDGRLSEQILTEFKGMDLSYEPRIWNAHTAQDALGMIKERSYDLVIVMLRISDMNPLSFAEKSFDQELTLGHHFEFCNYM